VQHGIGCGITALQEPMPIAVIGVIEPGQKRRAPAGERTHRRAGTEHRAG
jgi:hypothetical protein